MTKTKKVLQIISWILLGIFALIILFNVTCFIKRAATNDTCPTVFGFGSAVVISGSMEPNISLYDMVVIQKRDTYELRDVVIFRSDSYCVTHRIVDMRTDENGQVWVTTQGDANNAPDSEIEFEKIVGKVIFTIPKVGYIQNFLKQPIGFLLLTIVVAVLLFIPEWIRRIKQNRKDDEH